MASGEKLIIDGGADKAHLTDNNIGVVSDGSKLTVKLSKDIDLGSEGSLTVGNTAVTTDGLKVGDTKVATDGLSITRGPSVTKSGIDAGNKNIMAPRI